MSIRQEFTCRKCGYKDVVDYQVDPIHCGVQMRGGDMRFPKGNENQTRLHLITLFKTPVVQWQLPEEPNHVFELWKLAPGRAKGERLGWIGARETIVEWKTPNGVAIKGGFANTIEEAAGFLLEALDGGIFARANIEAEVA